MSKPEHWAWERQTTVDFDYVSIVTEQFGWQRGVWIDVPVEDLDAFIAWLQSIRDEVRKDG